jgi:hypothetical protein
LRLARTKLSLDALRQSAAALSLRTQLVPNALSLMCFHKDQLIRIRTNAMLETYIFLGRIAVRTVHLPRPNRGLAPHQADSLFGQIRTDATLQVYAYSGQIGALGRVKRTLSSVKSGPTRRSRRALTLAKSEPRATSSGLHLRSNRDRRDAPGVRLLWPNRGLGPRQADFIFGQIGTVATRQACA